MLILDSVLHLCITVQSMNSNKIDKGDAEGYSCSPFLSLLQHFECRSVEVAKPLAGLLLGVYKERPALAACQDHSVLHRHPIRRQALVVPGCNAGLLSQKQDRVQAFCQRDEGLEHEV